MVENNHEEKPRPHGEVKVWKSGHAFFPVSLRKELKIDEDKKLPYYLDSTTLLITRKDITTKELLKEIDLLKEIIIRRKEDEPNPPE